MRILYLAHRIPYPPNKGDKIRAYHQLRHLAAEHEVHLCTLVDDPDDMRHAETLRELCSEVDAFWLGAMPARARALVALLSGRSFSPAFFGEPRAAARVGQLLEGGGWDASIIFSSGVGGLLPDSLPPRGLVTLADYCDLDSAKWSALARGSTAPRSWMYGAEARALARYELDFADRCERIVFATPLEAEDFAALAGSRSVPPIEVIANGVDHDFFANDGSVPMADKPTIVFTGAMDYRPNFEAANWFIDEVWPELLQRHPDARLRIVGREPPRSLQARGDRPGIEVTGTVPDIRPYLHSAWLSIAPIKVARGVQNKVLEAMAATLPTIISPAVDRGLEARADVETLVADDRAEWLEAVSSLLLDPRRREELGKAGERYVRRRHHWDRHGREWLDLLAAEANDTRRRGAA
jgi:sugar transferase (PEP-CTERM/EpsH1 system associated)